MRMGIVVRGKAGHAVGRLLWVIMVVTPVVATDYGAMILAHGSEEGRESAKRGEEMGNSRINRAALPRSTRLEAVYGSFQASHP